MTAPPTGASAHRDGRVFYSSDGPWRGAEGGAVVIDYREARDAIAAQKLLARAGIVAVYVPDHLVRVPADPDRTVWLAQRLRVPTADAARAAELLDEYDLR